MTAVGQVADDQPPPTSDPVSAPGRVAASIPLRRARAIAAEELRGLAERDIELFTVRLARWWADLVVSWAIVYGSHPDGRPGSTGSSGRSLDRYQERQPALRRLDLERDLRPDWFQDPSMIGYVCYAARFGGDARRRRASTSTTSTELRIRYLHLMPCCGRARGETDGGYAVTDYRAVDPSLGHDGRPRAPLRQLRGRGISLCVDLVLNHTAPSTPGRRRAAAGDAEAAAMYRIFPDRTLPDRYERTLPEVFPELAPGNFTALADGRWVWTTFNPYQWDLNWSNPAVFVEMTDVLLDLANRGVEVFRLDAVAFLWKRMGTDCQNQPEVHDLLQALRACARIAAPAVIFKAEAIVAPETWRPTSGVGRHHGRVSDMAYHNSLMVQFWSALAARDARLMTQVLRGVPAKPATTAWATYIRCHDDIGWAITEEDAARSAGAAGRTGRSCRLLRRRLPGLVRAAARCSTTYRATGDSRMSGTFASLAGLEARPRGRRSAAGRRRDRAHPPRTRADHGLGRGPAHLHGRRDRPAQRPRRIAPIPTGGGQPLAAPAAMDWAVAERRHDRDGRGPHLRGPARLIDARRGAPQLHAATPARGRRPATPRCSRSSAASGRLAGGDPRLRRRPDGSCARRPAAGRRAAGVVDLLDPGSRRRRTEPVAIPPHGRALARRRRMRPHDAWRTRVRAVVPASATIGGAAGSSTRSTRAASPTATATGRGPARGDRSPRPPRPGRAGGRRDLALADLPVARARRRLRRHRPRGRSIHARDASDFDTSSPRRTGAASG